MALKVTTSDDHTQDFPDGAVLEFQDGGVLVVRDDTGTAVFFAPTFWQKVEQDAPGR